MVKYITIFVYLSVFAVSLSAQTGNALFSQTYSFESLRGGLISVTLADDFVPVLSGDVSNVVLWMVHTGVQPANIFIRITKDNGDNNPNTATLVTSGLSSATHVDTGDLFPGDYPIYRTTCTLPTPATVAAGDTYWLEVDMTAGSLWCVQIPVIFGSTVWFYSEGNLVSSVALIGQEFDSFFELHNSLALEANTWGAIKASF